MALILGFIHFIVSTLECTAVAQSIRLKGGYVICTSVIPCSSSGLAKNNRLMYMFVLFSRLFWLF